MKTLRFFTRRLHLTPETVLSRDHFLRLAHLYKLDNGPSSRIAQSLTTPSQYQNIEKWVQPANGDFEWAHNKKYVQLWERLLSDPNFELRLQERVSIVRRFLGDEFPLLLPELIAILCGNSHLEVWVSTLTTDTPKDKTCNNMFIPQERLRQLGRSFFDLSCSVSLVFTDQYYLALSQHELEVTLKQYLDRDRLVKTFMTRHSLNIGLVPFRRKPKIKSPERRNQIKTSDLDINCIGSFYTMLGILLVKFGQKKVREDLWQDKIYGSPSGILKIAMDSQNWE